MVPIASFVRLKPLDVDHARQAGGTASEKHISGFDEEAGTVHLSTKSGTEVYSHATAALGPATTQAKAYQVMCQPLVRAWLDGIDVDFLSYGQTGSGKTFTMFGPPLSMARAVRALGEGGGAGIAPEGILLDEHGFTLRAGLEALAAVEAINASGSRAVLHGSMVEMTIMTLTDQAVTDLLNHGETCFVDKSHHLQGARQVPLQTAGDVVRMAAAVETRLTRGTKMNDSSSRSHCATVFTLSLLDAEGGLRQSRLQFFDLMGSERFKGGNAAHDASKSSKSSAGGAV
jgi:hypothetical protein